MEEEQLPPSEIKQIRREISFDLNRLSDENSGQLFSELSRFAKERVQICEALIEAIVEAVWKHPSYRSCYVELCRFLNSVPPK